MPCGERPANDLRGIELTFKMESAGNAAYAEFLKKILTVDDLKNRQPKEELLGDAFELFEL